VNPEAAFVLLVVAVAFVLFWTEALAVELVGLLALLALVVGGVLEPAQAFHGFGSPALVMIGSVLILSASLVRNGAGERIVVRLERLSRGGHERVVPLLFGTVILVSAFINNVAATAMFLPVAESLARIRRIPPARLLMPVAFASLLGGVCTLTGTSTNVAVAGALVEHGQPPLGLFELTPIGVPLAIVGALYLVLFSRWLPGRVRQEDAGEGDRRFFMTELEVPPGSPAIGKTLRELDLGRRARLHPLGLIRGAVRLVEGILDTPLREGDIVVAEGDARAVNRAVSAAGLRRKTTRKRIETGQGGLTLVEATVSYNSPLIGRTLREVDLRGRYGLDVVALWRRGGPVIEKIGDIRLRVGDVLLLQGAPERIRRLAGDPLYLLVADRFLPRYEPRKERLSILVFGLALLAAAIGALPVSVAFLLGAVLVVALGCIPLEEAYRALNLKLIVLIGAMIGVSQALDVSGAAAWLARSVLQVAGGAGSHHALASLAAIYWLTVLLTQPMSNAAAALLVLPVALDTATLAGVDPRPFAVTVAVAASLAFMTPLEPACLLVMSTGRYRFRDFLALGAPLTFLCFGMVLALVPVLFPF